MLAAAGVVLASYLVWVHFNEGALVCGVGDCHTVQASDYATVGPLPVAVLGLGMYAAVLACNLLGLARPALAAVTSSITFAATLAGAVYAVYLTWLEVAVIRAICQWCVASAVLTMLLAILAGLGVWRMLGTVPSDDETESGPTASWIGEPAGSGTTGASGQEPAGGKVPT